MEEPIFFNPIREKTRKTMLYNKEDLIQAADAVREGGLTLRQAAELYSVPKSTLRDKVQNRYPSKKKGEKIGNPKYTAAEKRMIKERAKVRSVFLLCFKAASLRR